MSKDAAGGGVARCTESAHELRRRRIDHRAGHGGTVLSHQSAALEHPGGAEAGEGVEAQDVGLVARPESTELGEAVVLGRIAAWP